MDQVDTLFIDRYSSEILCCTITTHLSDLLVKVNFVLKFLVKVFVSQGTCIF